MTVAQMASMGGQARAESLSAGELTEIGKKGAAAKWAGMSEADRKRHGAKLAAARKKKRAEREKAGKVGTAK